MRQKNRCHFHSGNDCIEKFCKDLKEDTAIISFKEKEMTPLTNKEIKSYEKQKVCHMQKKSFVIIKTKKSQRSLSLHRKI